MPQSRWIANSNNPRSASILKTKTGGHETGPYRKSIITTKNVVSFLGSIFTIDPHLFYGYNPDMYLAKVIGTVVATQRYRDLEGIRFMLIQPLTKELKPRGVPRVAADSVDAGPGEIVYCVGSREASQAFEPNFIPVDDAIVGIVDTVTVQK